MQNKTIIDLKSVFSHHNFTATSLTLTPLYVFESKILDELGHPISITELSNLKPNKRYFKIINPIDNNSVSHICIDGHFIPFGQQKYDINSPSKNDGRPDCVVFDDSTFLFVELKLEQLEISFDNEKSKWKRFFEGLNQIEDFVNFLKSEGFEIQNYYSQVYAIVCMRFEPIFRSNSARNNEIFKRTQKLGFEIIARNHFEFAKL